MESAQSLYTSLCSLARRSPWLVISGALHVVILAIFSVLYVHERMSAPAPEPGEWRVAAPAAEKVLELEPLPEPPRDSVPKLVDSQFPLVPDPEQFQVAPPTTEVESKDPPPTLPFEPPPLEISTLDPGISGGTAIGPNGPGRHGTGVPTSVSGPPGGGGGWKYGARFPGRGTQPGTPGGGDGTPAMIRAGLEWLRAHQDSDGRWDAAGFSKHCGANGLCDGPGSAIHDVGITGLALLAFLGNGNTLRQGVHREVVRSGVRWLRQQQGEDGLIGAANSHAHLYDHGIATLALCEAYGLSAFPPLRPHVQRAVDFIQRARNPYKVWRYHARDGSNDTSVTGWMVMVLKSAEDFGLVVDKSAFTAAASWFDEVTDPSTGQAGYTRRGENSSRMEGKLQRFPAVRTEAMTAVALLCRLFLGQDPRRVPVMGAATDTMLKKPPVWNETDGSIDMYYWYYASLALFQMGGDPWKQWSRKLGEAAVKSQRADGHARGSWNPVDAWSDEGGRVYSTAMMVLCLEAYYRYIRILR